MVEVLERGNIYFVYRPKEERPPQGVEDVQRFYLVLKPQGKARFRLLQIGQKELPRVQDGGQRYWGFVEKVGQRAEEVEDELEAQPGQPVARPAGEGVYAIVRHENHTHLAYALELPGGPGPVQRALRIAPEASYVLAVKNPEAPSPRGMGLSEERQARFSPELQRRFLGRRFIEVDPPDFLDYPGAEVLLIGAARDVSEELGLELDPQRETEETAEVFNELRMERERHPVESLLKGEWR